MENVGAAIVGGDARPVITAFASPAREAPSRCTAERKQRCRDTVTPPRREASGTNRQLHPSRAETALRGAAVEDRHHSEAVNQPLEQRSLYDRCVANVRGSPARRRQSTARPSIPVPAVLAGATAC